MPEQLGLEQRRRQRRAVDAQQRLLRPRRQAVDHLREHLLAHARLADDEHVDVGDGGALGQEVDPPHLGTAADVVRRRRRRDVAALHPLAGARDQPVGRARVGGEEGDARARGDAAAAEQPDDAGTEVVDALGVVLEQDQLVLVGAVRGEHVGGPNPRRDQLADRFGRRARRDVQAHHGEHPPGRRRLVALLLEPPFEVGVRRQPAHAHRRTPPLDHQRRPPDRDRLAGQHLRALPRLQQVAAQARAVGAARSPRSPARRPRAGGRGAARRSARRCARRRSRRARSTRCPTPAAGASRRGSPPSRSGGGRRPRPGGRPPRARSARRTRSPVVTSLLPSSLAQRDEGRMGLAVAQIDA